MIGSECGRSESDDCECWACRRQLCVWKEVAGACGRVEWQFVIMGK